MQGAGPRPRPPQTLMKGARPGGRAPYYIVPCRMGGRAAWPTAQGALEPS